MTQAEREQTKAIMLDLIRESLLLFGGWLNENVVHTELGSHLDVEKAVSDFMKEVEYGEHTNDDHSTRPPQT